MFYCCTWYKKHSYEYEESSIGDRPIPINSTIEALGALGATLNFIYIWLNMFDHNYDVRCEAYNIAMKKMFQKIPTIKLKPLSQGQKVQKLMTWIGDGWYMEVITKGLPPFRRPKLSKKAQEKYYWNDWRFQLHLNKLE